jgi:hypothetical protein
MRKSTLGRWVARLVLTAAVGIGALAGSAAVLGSSALPQAADLSWQSIDSTLLHADDLSWQ